MPIIIRQPKDSVLLPLRAKMMGNDGDFVKVGVEGTWHTIQGRYVELFPVRVLAAAMLHRGLSIPVWEKDGFPKANYTLEANDHRWYTAEQVVLCNVVYRHFCNGKRCTKPVLDRIALVLRSLIYEPTLKVNAELDIITFRGMDWTFPEEESNVNPNAA